MEQQSSSNAEAARNNFSTQSFMSDFAEASNDLLMADSETDRAEAARRLATLGKPLASPYLIAALADPSWEVRQAVVESLGDIGEADAIGSLQELLDRGDQDALLQQAISRAINLISARVSATAGPALPAVSFVPSDPEWQHPLEAPTQAEGEELHLQSLESATAEKHQIAPIDAQRVLAEVEARIRGEKEKLLAAEIEALRKAEADQAKRIEEANAQAHRHLEQEARQRTESLPQDQVTIESENKMSEVEAASRELVAKEQQLLVEIEMLRHSEAEHVERMNKLTANRSVQQTACEQAESEARFATEEHEKTVAELQALRQAMATAAQSRTATEKHLHEQIQAERNAEAEHLRRIEVATASLHEHELARKEAEEKAQRASARVEAEASQVTQLQILRDQALSQAQTTAAEKQRLTLAIEKLSKVANEQKAAMDEAKLRLTALEESRNRAETKVRQRAERELRLQQEIEQLRQAEEQQIERIAQAEAEVHRLREAEIRLKAETELQRKAEAEAREIAAKEELRQVAEEAQRQAEEHAEKLRKLQTIREKTEAAAQKRTEQEQQLSVALETISKAAAEQLTRIREAQTRLRAAEAKSRELADEEERLQAALAAQHQADQESRRQAAEIERAQLKAEIETRAKEEADRITELESIRSHAEVEAQHRAELLQQLTDTIESLKTSESEQVKQIEELRAESQARSEAEGRRLAELEAMRNQTAQVAQQRAAREQELNLEIGELHKLEAEQVKRLEEAENNLVALEEQRLKNETKAQQKSEREQRLSLELTSLKEAIAAQSKRIAEATDEHRRLQEEQARLNAEEDARQLAENEERERAAEGRRQHLQSEVERRAQQHEKHLADLEAIRAKAEQEAAARTATEQQLNSNIQMLRKSEIEQRQRIAQAESELRQAQTEARLLAEEQIRLRTEAETLQREEAEARRKAAKEMRLLVENEAQQRALEETRALDELEAIRSRIETEAERRVEAERQLNAGVEALRKAEALQRKRIAEAEAESERLAEATARMQAEENARQQAEDDARQQALAEQLRSAELRAQQQAQEDEENLRQLEKIRSAAEESSQRRTEKIDSINSEIAALREIEVSQSNQIQEAEARLSEFEAICQRLGEEAAELLAEEERRRTAFSEERHRAFENRIAEAKEHAQRVEQEEEQRAAKLEALRDELAAKSEQTVARQGQLSAEIAALEQLQAEQLERLRDSEASILAHKAALQAAEVEAAQRAHEEDQYLKELQALINNSEADSQLKTTAARELRTQLEMLRKAEARQLKALQKLEERRIQAEEDARRHSAREAELVAELNSIRARVEQNEQSWPDKEINIKAQIEALRRAESVQLKRAEKLMARLEAEQQKTVTTKTKGRTGKSSAPSTTRKNGSAPMTKQWLELLQSIRSETEFDIKERTTKEEQLKAQLQALLHTEVEQMQRIEEAKVRLNAREMAIEAQAKEEAALLQMLSEHPHEVETVIVDTETNDAESEDHPGDESSDESTGITDADLVQPLETWQFAMIDEREFVGQVEETMEPLPLIQAEEVDRFTEPSPVEQEFALDDELQLDQFETHNQGLEVTEVEPYRMVESPEPEKAIEVASGDSPVARLVEGLKSNDAAQRSATYRELATLDEDQAFHLITDLFEDTSEDVRNAAARALHEFTRDCAASFTRALREASPERRSKIAAAINGSGLAAEAVESLIGESREKTHDAFSMLFLMAKAGEVQPLLKTIEQHPDVSVRLSVVRLLTFCNQPSIIPAFRSLAVRATLPTEIRSAIMEAIYQISSNAKQSAA